MTHAFNFNVIYLLRFCERIVGHLEMGEGRQTLLFNKSGVTYRIVKIIIIKKTVSQTSGAKYFVKLRVSKEITHNIYIRTLITEEGKRRR